MSLFNFFREQWGGLAFDPATDIPSLKDRVILVTGATSGLGRQCVLEFARHQPAQIFLAARSLERIRATIDDLQKEIPNAPPMRALELDLSSFASVKAAAATFLAQSPRLDILMLNAGVVFGPACLTTDGYELRFGTNHMGHALLTKLLLPALLRTVEQHNPDVRVVILSSAGVVFALWGGIDFPSLTAPGTSSATWQLYGQSKLANGLFGQELARRYPQLKVACVHPGTIGTNIADPLLQNWRLLKLLWPLVPPLLSTVERGVRNQLWAAVAEEVVSGEFYMPVGVVGNSWGLRKVRDKELARELWDWTEKEFSNHDAKAEMP